ncbi:MAG: hypothetical protein WC510_00760 [Candidatus Omnitrophota bacterium]
MAISVVGERNKYAKARKQKAKVEASVKIIKVKTTVHKLRFTRGQFPF